jgi:hypothetical protein
VSLVLATLAMSAAVATAQAPERPAPGGPSSRGTPGTDRLTGKVTEVNPRARTFTVLAGGKAVVLSGAELATLPKVGQVIDVTYARNPAGGPPTSKTFNESRSNAL